VRGGAQAERTASVIWRMLSLIQSSVFLWNVFPLHPHERDKPFTNRAHTSKERIAGEEILRELIALLQPKQVVAIGRDAAESAGRCSNKRTVVSVRHPSYGGMRDFEQGLSATYGLTNQKGFSSEIESLIG
jgi:uracil-DNA glycosylase